MRSVHEFGVRVLLMIGVIFPSVSALIMSGVIFYLLPDYVESLFQTLGGIFVFALSLTFAVCLALGFLYGLWWGGKILFGRTNLFIRVAY